MPATIKCPKCANEFDIEDVLYSEVEQKLKKEHQEAFNIELQEVRVEKENLNREKHEFEEKKKKANELFSQKVQHEKQKFEKEIRTEIEKENLTKVRFLEDKVTIADTKIKKLEEKELEALRLKNELEELKRDQETEKKKYLLENSQTMIDHALQKQSELFELEKSEKEIQLETLRKTIEELKRKSDQGSMQTQGEALEVLLERFLKENFPFDEISEVAKGKEGADLTHIIKNEFRQDCGKILYECKDVRSWNEKWIEKLKDDTRKDKGDLAVIVSTVLPKYVEKIGKKDGVWICGFSDVKIVAAILRDSLLRVHEANKLLENVSDKKEQLYKYMTGIEFKQKWEAIIETYVNMQKQLSKEKVRTLKDWSEREKQLELMLKNSMAFIGDVKGIGGLEIQDIKLIDEGNDN